MPLNDRNRCNEAVTAPRKSFDEPGVIRVVVKSGAKSLQNYVETPVEINVSPFRPESLPQFLPADDFPRTFEEEEQKSEWLVLNFDAGSAASKSIADSIDFERAKAKENSGRGPALHEVIQ
jgi:hypothetical protein